ncbi:hypothetical protein [Hansschlegelia zhihuaiae]|uniref:DUF1835 domain-containing protein n=1 Tax=Hansschlegelia zhihuaiae TaxID=405005 RepID=A0A4Q0MLN8_9HYPH|nr:hypothetical protein [Hansschlegelia zhihuaiae]RXF73976.1 hypothetical protein EK403_08395 [Hansschlegelia zhihuaiae]
MSTKSTPDQRPDDVLVITNGDSAVARLEEAGVAGLITPWRDVLHDGPVPAMAELESLSAIRATFIAADLGLGAEEVATEFRSRDATIRRHASFPRVEIWLEHDLYDQLQLLQILDFFRSEQRLEGLYLVQADDYLGHQPPDAMRRLADSAAPVTDEQQRLASDVWAAFTSATPHALARFAAADTSALPHLAPALKRLLAELPDPVRGLTLTEERALAHLAREEITTGELFRRVTEEDQAQFLGDASFFRRLDGLAFAERPLIDGLPAPSKECCGLGRAPDRGYAEFARARLRLTKTGRDVLSGRLDHRVVNRADHWVGGVHVSPAALIRYDRAGGQLVAPM